MLFPNKYKAEVVAQFKYTVLIMPSGVNLVTGLPFAVEKFQSEYAIPEGELKVITTIDKTICFIMDNVSKAKCLHNVFLIV